MSDKKIFSKVVKSVAKISLPFLLMFSGYVSAKDVQLLNVHVHFIDGAIFDKIYEPGQ